MMGSGIGALVAFALWLAFLFTVLYFVVRAAVRGGILQADEIRAGGHRPGGPVLTDLIGGDKTQP